NGVTQLVTNFDVLQQESGAPVKLWARGVPVAREAKRQLLNTAAMPFIFKHVAAMPDVHVGLGSTIGSVIPTKGAIIPAAVGVDLGCGMMAVRTSLTATDLPDDLRDIRLAIEKAVPHGRTGGRKRRDVGAWHNTPALVDQRWAELKPGFERIVERYPRLRRTNNHHHLGTLGTANHLVELCLDELDRVWVMLHSGSRGVGNAIGPTCIEMGNEELRIHQSNLPEEDLAYLQEGTVFFDDYVEAVTRAQYYAKVYREVMTEHTLRALSAEIPTPSTSTEEAVDCRHNYVQEEEHYGEQVWVTRKGAVSARAGQMGIIPGSMGARSFIVRGLGN